MIPAPIYAFVPFFPGDRTNKALPGEFLSEAGTGLSWTPTWYGVGASMDKTNDGHLQDTSLGDARFDGFAAASAIWVYSWSDSVGSDNFGAIIDHSHSFDGWGLGRFSSGSTPALTLQTSTERVEIRNDSATIDTGDVHVTLSRWISDTEWEMSTYRLPGFQVLQERIDTGAASVPSGTWTLIPGDDIFIGANNSSTVGLSGLTIYAYLFWNRALTREQLKAVAANPHAFVRPSVIPVVFAPAVATTPHGVFGLPLQGPFAGPFG